MVGRCLAGCKCCVCNGTMTHWDDSVPLCSVLDNLEPEEQIDKLQWIWLVSHAITTASNLKDIIVNRFTEQVPK